MARPRKVTDFISLYERSLAKKDSNLVGKKERDLVR